MIEENSWKDLDEGGARESKEKGDEKVYENGEREESYGDGGGFAMALKEKESKKVINRWRTELNSKEMIEKWERDGDEEREKVREKWGKGKYV